MNIYEMHSEIKSLLKAETDTQIKFDTMLKNKVMQGVEFFDKENFMGDGIMFTSHFHYGAAPRFSLHPMSKKNQCKEWQVEVDDITYMITASSVTLQHVEELHRRLLS